MAIRIDPNKDLVIDNFQFGIGKSPYTGFADIRNADLFTKPGIVRTNRRTDKVSSTTVTELLKWIVKDPGGNFYGVSETDGKVYKAATADGTWSVISGNTTTAASANGLAVWKDFLFVARDAFIDVMKISDESWTNGFQTLTSDVDWHPMWVGQDDILYIGNSNGVASLKELTDFDPGTGSTFTYTAAALDLPEGIRVKCLTELGKWLMIGTIVGTGLQGGEKGADIFPWDRVASSFELPLRLDTFGVHQMVTVGNIVYAIAGLTGSIYRTNVSSFQLVRKLPISLVLGSAEVNTTGLFLNFYPGAITYFKDRIYFGVSSGTTGSNIADALGVWSMGEDGTLTFEQKISTGVMTADNNLKISSLYPSGSDNILIGWQDNTTFGLDHVGSNRYAAFSTVIISPLYQVGTELKKRTFEQLEFTLSQALASSQGVRIGYRTDINDSFTTIDTFDFDTFGAVLTLNSPVDIVDAVVAQFKIELDNPATTLVELMEVRVR